MTLRVGKRIVLEAISGDSRLSFETTVFKTSGTNQIFVEPVRYDDKILSFDTKTVKMFTFDWGETHEYSVKSISNINTDGFTLTKIVIGTERVRVTHRGDSRIACRCEASIRGAYGGAAVSCVLKDISSLGVALRTQGLLNINQGSNVCVTIVTDRITYNINGVVKRAVYHSRLDETELGIKFLKTNRDVVRTIRNRMYEVR